ncbi:Hypothetical protein A7982_09769 [Minicystis rosea]|nr:Hypothetical protein A7982_09769 [Minicystis rosea]
MNQSKYTMVAAKAVSLAELFEARFEAGLEGPVRCRVELSAPDGPSTAGGKQALQHIKLVPADGTPAIVIGSANTIRQTAEIRTFDHIAALYAQRFKGARIPIDVTRFQELSQNLATFFRAMQLTVTFADARSAGLAAPQAEGPARSFLVMGIVIGSAVALCVLAVAYWAIFLRH